jgi:hypothetical protein
LEQKKKSAHGLLSATSHAVDNNRWRTKVQAEAVLPAYPYPHILEERTNIKDQRKL